MLPALGCGDDGTGEDGGSTTDATGTTGTNTMSSGPTDATVDTTSDPTVTTTDPTDTTTTNPTDPTDPDPTTTTDPTETTTTDPTEGSGTMGACQVWEITYDLDGSEFEISNTPFGAGDQVNTAMMPYDADDTVGPGTFVLRFEDVGGEPGGTAAMVSYQMGIHFVVDSGFTVVETDLDADAGPDECGVTTGMVSGTTVTWMPSAIVGHHSMGQVLCTGNLCGAGGLPNGMPVMMDEVSDQPVDDFEFSADFTSFTMAQIVTAMDANSTTAWSYVGTETSRQLVDAPPCLCP